MFYTNNLYLKFFQVKMSTGIKEQLSIIRPLSSMVHQWSPVERVQDVCCCETCSLACRVDVLSVPVARLLDGLSDRREFEVWQILPQFAVTGCLLELPIRF